VKASILTSTLVAISMSVLFASTHLLTVVYEYTVGPNGARQNLKMVMCQDPMTKQMLPNALTEKEKQLGADLLRHRKSPGSKNLGQKRYEFLLFDADTREYRE
jgi:hypothetical protein